MFLQACILVLSLGAVAQGAPRVVGGNVAPNHKYPYLASIREYGHPYEPHLCGASILNERWLLTAAHCIHNQPVSVYYISVGTNLMNESGTVYLPERIIVHKDYSSVYGEDIALIRLKSDIVFTDFVKKIALPDQDLQDYSGPAAFAGWGTTELWGREPNELQEITLNVITNEQCKLKQPYITDAHICTLNKLDEGVCHGDSGSPLVVDGVQVGISSYAKTCAINFPDVFTRVWSYRTWIDEIMKQYDNVEE